MTQWKTQACSITNNHKDKVNFCLTKFSAKQPMVWEFHVDDSA